MTRDWIFTIVEKEYGKFALLTSFFTLQSTRVILVSSVQGDVKERGMDSLSIIQQLVHGICGVPYYSCHNHVLASIKNCNLLLIWK